MQWSSDNCIECLPHFEKMALSQFKVYIEAKKRHKFLCVITVTWVLSFNLLMLKKGFSVFYIWKGSILVCESGIRRIDFILFLGTWIHWESINHALRSQRMKCCLKNIELLLSRTKMHIPRRVTCLHYDQINFNIHKMCSEI